MSYLKRVLIALDEFGNTCADGNPQDTISSRVGRNAALGKRWAIICRAVINWIALKVFGQADHCQRAIVVVDLALGGET